ncbi:TonB family protein [Pontibacter anaerobius]|uniref:TonB family protein n=1 Tax=Pontibacter anaerobius TaxID=2993940 RepID=A0ABT3REP7_9BACT|nr:TonB family protein [Pontibacter anaerobius]MCX2739899.1 TonB family protein [Pontibacter anaerobius]
MKNTFKQLTTAALLSMALLAAAPSAHAQKAEKPYTVVEQMPTFKGGENELMKFLGTNIHYPEDAVKAGVQGLVVLSFVIDANGSVSDVQVVKPLSTSTDAEATRVVKLTDNKWVPGKQGGKVVAVKYTLPIRFAIKEEQKGTATPDQQPQFKGGQEALMRSINQKLKMPQEAKKENLDARVVVKFTVEKDGSVSNIQLANTKLKKTVGPDAKLDYMDASTFNLQNKTILAKLAEAAAEAVKVTSGQWQPATKNGTPVAAEMYLPVQFMGSEIENDGSSHISPAKQKAEQHKSAYTYEEVEVKPQLKNGPLEKHIAKNLRYPTNTDFEGDVMVKLVIDETGRMLAPMAASEDKSITDEIFRVLDLTRENWIAGKVDGTPVTTLRNLNIRFVQKDRKQVATASAAKPADVIVTRHR